MVEKRIYLAIAFDVYQNKMDYKAFDSPEAVADYVDEHEKPDKPIGVRAIELISYEKVK